MFYNRQGLKTDNVQASCSNYCKKSNYIKIPAKAKTSLVAALAIMCLVTGGAASKYEAKGNTTGNIINNGLLAQQGNWVYGYIEDGLYRWTSDGTNKTKLNSTGRYYISAANDWIYYSSDGTDIHKMKADGTNDKEIYRNDGPISGVTVSGDWIYFCRFSGNGQSLTADDGELFQFKLYKIKTDGSGLTKLSNDDLGPYYMYPCIDIENGWIYYNNYSDEFKLYKIKTDGTGRVKCFEGMLFDFNIAGDYIYYANGKDNNKLYRIKADGTENTKLSDDDSVFVNVSGDWIYYLKSLGDWDYNVYKIKTDGTGRIKLCDDILSSDFDGRPPAINIAGNYIYYQIFDTYGVDSQHYKIKTDGTAKELLWKETY
ncbi:hypothetical protein OXPF_27410 [Oxobacter pfennigii]|uniref:Prolow-density lipoprotein receptor-related protein 1-like beta-propeller domain-containing protein n=1 Tax=Oxobacter pfennigii TaxID=36849 RepID=A0A0P8W6E5_9CLOT|nr:DUF5050 domain-containing protein [Oxobacter pfennigii]KPU43300.1 hypothetical protein OXPF_27410 [Oxobacter pfennigii]